MKLQDIKDEHQWVEERSDYILGIDEYSEGGYYYTLYDLKGNEVDGGLCTGTYKDTIELALS